MIRSSQFKVVRIQCALFFADLEAFSAAPFLGAVLSDHADRFDATPQVLPLTDDAPVEFPRVVLQSQDRQWQMQGGPMRVDAVWSVTDEHLDAQASVEEVIRPLLAYAKRPLPLSRIGLVLHRGSLIKNASHELIKHFCNPESRTEALNRSDAFEVHNLKRYKLEAVGLEINSWVRCKAGLNVDGREVLTIEHDLNSIENVFPHWPITSAYLSDAFQAFVAEAEQILKVYFPEDVVK